MTASNSQEVLFTVLAHRYERHRVLLTSNLVFSQWERIFKDPMTTAAAVDRLGHHSAILEMNLPSYRIESAKKQAAIKGTGERRKCRQLIRSGRFWVWERPRPRKTGKESKANCLK